MTRIAGIISGILMGLIWLGAIHAQASIPDPDDMVIESARAYSGVINTGDMLVVINYDITYDTLPSLAATDAFICRFFVDDLEVNAAEIIAFNDLGYGLGVCSMYFSETDLTAAGIEFGNPNAEDYDVVVQGKPSAFADPPTVQTPSIDYRSVTQTAALLLTDIVNLAMALQNNAGWIAGGFGADTLITFTSGQQVLTDVGTAYFGQAIPNLQIMIPDLFGSSTTTPDVIERDYQFSERDRLLTIWDASPFGPSIQLTADNFHIDKVWVLSLMGLVIVIGASVAAKNMTGSPEFGILAAFLTFPIMIAGGLGTMTAVFFVAALFVIGLMFALFLRRAN